MPQDGSSSAAQRLTKCCGPSPVKRSIDGSIQESHGLPTSFWDASADRPSPCLQRWFAPQAIDGGVQTGVGSCTRHGVAAVV